MVLPIYEYSRYHIHFVYDTECHYIAIISSLQANGYSRNVLQLQFSAALVFSVDLRLYSGLLWEYWYQSLPMAVSEV